MDAPAWYGNSARFDQALGPPGDRFLWNLQAVLSLEGQSLPDDPGDRVRFASTNELHELPCII
jgi:hypothetical protein